MVERLPSKEKVAGSTPVSRSQLRNPFLNFENIYERYRRVAQVARARALGARGRRFKSCLSDKEEESGLSRFFCFMGERHKR